MTHIAWTYIFFGFTTLFGLMLVIMRFWKNQEVFTSGVIIILMSIVGILGTSGHKVAATIAMICTVLMCTIWIAGRWWSRSPKTWEEAGEPTYPPDNNSLI